VICCQPPEHLAIALSNLVSYRVLGTEKAVGPHIGAFLETKSTLGHTYTHTPAARHIISKTLTTSHATYEFIGFALHPIAH
jgi:hypothetical protein